MNNLKETAVIRSAARASTILTVATLGVLALATAIVVWRVAAPQTLSNLIAPHFIGGYAGMGSLQLTLLTALSVIGFTAWALILWWARSMFARLADGSPEKAARFARRIAIGLWVLLAWQILGPVLGSVIATWHQPAGERSVSLALGLGHVGTLLSAFVASAMAHALEFGVELWRDHKEII